MTTAETGLTPEERAALEAGYRAAVAYRAGLPDGLARPTASMDEMAARFEAPLPDGATAGDQVISAIVESSRGGIHAMSASTFFAYVCGASHPVGVAADALVSAWGQNAASTLESPAVAAMERALCNWLIDLFGLPSATGVGLVTGASVANFCAVMAARNAMLADRGWNVDRNGLFGAPELPVLISQDAHSAVTAALRYAGMGAGRAIPVATDDQGRMRPDALTEALGACDAPPLVILQAGQINTGAFDPFAELIPQVKARGGWVHVDGAFGLWAAAVPELAPRCAGVELADSWAVDLHKSLNAPFDAGVVLVRDRSTLVQAMAARGAYLPAQSGHWEPSDSTPELSRRARGVPSYAILRHLGRSGLREMILRHHDLARHIAAGLRAEPGLHVLNEVAFNQVAMTCATGAEGDALTRRVLARVQGRGRVYPSHGAWRGRDIIRISVSGYGMQMPDADLLVAEIIAAWRAERDL
ncbi:aminotransferase class V-fold PLP-dependent enzyme [Marinovum sp. 2_MG-2023]|uniref:pyridoxal phosphate-dependent decarboxylase family protein n=1 Tax=unclassified Marinovum TaxID=2647166 RepID=UPI0026E35C36|nr:MULTISPECIES: aminotransferase class V-fold PLP-dependent enzyme [unclassified Marinovum]MDO6730154.1 aminotransferase class V-fold PLP-dependent enzyme [Marinovum sp. 2_MG-2023]MDO6778892.1 aminotransferase class V-fold PLP-dependent enzyme [Marinovum sp. 1_MG-2023]